MGEIAPEWPPPPSKVKHPILKGCLLIIFVILGLALLLFSMCAYGR
jgi:hypothetical protein